MIRYEVKEGVAIVTLDRPEKLNALRVEMRQDLGDYFEKAAKDESVRCVLLKSTGRAFCAGGDVEGIAAGTPDSIHEVHKLSMRMIRNLVAIDKPVIAAVRGPVAGMGWSLALACDIVIASETAKFSQVFRHIGLVPDGGAVWFLSHYIGTMRAKELVFSGRHVPVEEAHGMGLVARVVADAELEDIAWKTALDYAVGPTRALAEGKKMFRFMQRPTLDELLEVEAAAQYAMLGSEDHREGARAFLEKRKPTFVGK